MHVAAPDPARLPLLRRRRRRSSSPGVDRVHRPQRAGQDQPGRGDRLPLPARLAPGRDRRAAGPGRRRAGAGPGGRGRATAGRATLEVELNPGRSNRARVNRSPLPRARELLGLVRTVVFSPEDLTLVKGDPSDRRRFLDDLLVLRTPRLAGVRADYDRVLRQRNSLLKTAGAGPRRAAREESALSTLGVWDAHLARTGAELLAARLALVDAAAARTSARRTRRSPAARRRDDAEHRVRAVVRARRRAPSRAALTDALLAELERRRSDELDRGISLVGPHRDELVLTLGTADARLPVKGYASPRGVLVVRARAAAGVVRPAARRRRRPDPDPGRRVRRARHRAARASWPSWSPAPSRCWSPRRSAADVPAALAGVRYAVADGEVRSR